MELDNILKQLKDGKISPDEAKKMISLHSIERVENMAQLDTGRAHRRGIPEVILAEPKKLKDILSIIKQHPKTEPLVVSRIQDKHMPQILSLGAELKLDVDVGQNSGTILMYGTEPPDNMGTVGILTAGTSDIPVAEEARLMCRAMGCRTISHYDVGIAGLHRTFPVIRELIQNEVDCIVVAAGMEGALATLVASMVDIPVIGVPVSVGYGYGSDGMASLAAMLQSCALGLTVVNIDGGVVAGAAAASIARSANRKRTNREHAAS